MVARGRARRAIIAGLTAASALAVLVVATPAPGSTNAEAELRTLPGLGEVNYGQVAAYSAVIRNTGTATLKNITYRNPIPETIVDGEPQQATFLTAGCEGTLTATEFSCVVTDRLRAGESASVTIAWTTPTEGSSAGCESEPCLLSTGSWQASARTFAVGPAETGLLSGNDPSKSATYAVAACTDPSSPTLQTNPNLSLDNVLSTSVCAPSLPANAPGLVTSIEERSGEGITETSDICLPSPGTECDESPFVFSPLATFTFTILNASLPEGDEIDTVFHNGVVVSKNRRLDPHVVIIKNERFKGITTVVVRSSENGEWDFG